MPTRNTSGKQPNLRKREEHTGGNKMKKNVNKVKCDIQSHIVATGYTQKEAVDACSAEYGWSDSDSNFSNKLDKQTLRYKEVLQLAEVLGYEIIWQRRRDA
jgi:basic membrane lipoprotein Med (substrate-binding protein (PBP1-ABC) superfamily)